MTPLNICMVGAGRVAEHYFKIMQPFIEGEELEVVAVVDVIGDKASNLAQRFGAASYNNVDQLSMDEFNLAVVMTPSGSHEFCSMELLSRGANVLCEKPIGLSIEKVEKNINLAFYPIVISSPAIGRSPEGYHAFFRCLNLNPKSNTSHLQNKDTTDSALCSFQTSLPVSP